MLTESAEDRLAALDAVANALAHPARRQILMAIHLRSEPVTAGQVAARFSHAWPTTTRHLRVLEDAGLVTRERKGRSQFYRVDAGALDVLNEWLAWFATPATA